MSVMFWLLFSCVLLITGKVLSISSPGSLTREVGQNALFMLNGTAILEATWGVRDGNTNYLNPRLIRVFNPGGAFQDTKLNSTSYAGRVSFVGDLTRGQAWFEITNLNINDTNIYLVKIIAKGESTYQYIPVQLTVTQPGSTPDPTTLISTSTITQNPTSFPPTKSPILKNLTTTLKVDRRFSEGMAEKTSPLFKNFSSEFEAEIKAAYTGETENNFKSVEVTSLSKGSILVTFIVFFESEITYDKACAPLENAIKDGKLGNFQIIPGSLGCSEQDSSTPRPPSPTTGVHPGIIAGVVVVGILAIAGLVMAILFVCRKKSSHKDYRGSTSGQEYAVERRAGEPEEQYACVQRSGASGAAVADKDNAPLPQYAAVDKNKKTKKKTRGPDELVYADLDHEYNKSIGARRPSDRHPTNDSGTVYADIQGSQGRQHPQQRQPPPRYGNLQAMDYA